ncbi:MAG: restriction endonuclease subunit S [Deltaproteobacteria bacterium]|nr:restriction endonuclease subunit S [Deltaproteobacteria bacterium]
MEVRDGYKQTEVGVIPRDWEVKKLGEIAELATGNTPPTNKPTNYGDQFFFGNYSAQCSFTSINVGHFP